MKPRLFDETAAQKHTANVRQVLFISHFSAGVKTFPEKINLEF